jgi:hypothetical protein
MRLRPRIVAISPSAVSVWRDDVAASSPPSRRARSVSPLSGDSSGLDSVGPFLNVAPQ